jgi:hypothetical protein
MNADDFSQSIRSLGTRYVQEYGRAVQSYTDLLNAVSRSTGTASRPAASDAQEMARRYADFVASQAPDVLSRLAEVSLSYYTALAELGIETISGYADRVLQAGAAASQSAAPSTSASRPSLLFHGTRGEQATNAFLIANHRDAAIDVAFEVAEVVSDDGTQRFRPGATFTPRQCRLAPHSERVVQCALAMSDEFRAGEGYRGTIAVAGFPDMTMPFSVQVEEPAGAGAAAAPAGQQEKAARRKAATPAGKTARKTAKKAAARKKATNKRPRG